MTTAGVAITVGVVVGWLSGDAYLTLGGHHSLFPAAVVLAAIATGPGLIFVGVLSTLFSSIGRVRAEDFRRL